jgi:hypothetical protein
VSRLASRSVAWLWPGRLALGKLAMLDGDPGLGKSLITLDLCARLSTGQPFPDGAPGPGASDAIVVNAEDGDEDTIRPRLQALGADLERVYVPERAGADESGPISFPGGTARLEEALRRTPARLVVIDPIVAFLEPTISVASDTSVRSALAPLARLAEAHACVILLVRHLNKRGGSRSLYRGGGSIGFLGACRSGWLVARDPQVPARCVLAQVKNNFAPPQPSLAYLVTPRESGPPALSWLGPTMWEADQLLAQARRAGSELERAKQFLTGFLAEGARTSRDIWQASRQYNLSEKTIRRAREDLGIRSLLVGVGPERLSYWLLDGQQKPTPPASDDDPPPDLEPWLAPLREQFPPATPLDDL